MKNKALGKKVIQISAAAIVTFGSMYGVAILASLFHKGHSIMDVLTSLVNPALALTLFAPLAAYILLNKSSKFNKSTQVVVFSLMLMLSLIMPCYLFTGAVSMGIEEPAIMRFVAVSLVSSIITVILVHFTVYSKK